MHFEGVSLSNKVYDEITECIRQSYPNSCVLYIDEVVNDELYSRYMARKVDLETKRGAGKVKELRLFHGTKSNVINNIAENGFMTSYNKTSAYGIGTYFSTSAKYSKDYTNKDKDDVSYMFVCDVLIGECGRVSGYTRINTDHLDNSVNNLEDPSIYVTPYDDGAYPRYMVAFHKNAM